MVDEIKVEKEDVKKTVDKKKDTIEVWWSTRDPKHMVGFMGLPDPKTGKAQMAVAKFDHYRFELDLSTPQGKHVSEELRRHNCYGVDIYILGGDGASDKDSQIAQDKLLRETAMSADGIEKLRGMFSHKELVDNNVNPSTNDLDELIWLAKELNRTPKGVL